MNFVKNAPNFACSFVYVSKNHNALHVFPLKFASFLKYYVCEKTHFPRAFSGDLLLNEKQKKSFVSLRDEVTIIPSFSYYCFVSRQGAEQTRFEFVLPRHRFDMTLPNFCSFINFVKNVPNFACSFMCVKQCSACFFPEVCFLFKILRMQKNLYLLSCQHVTAKTVISLKIQ